MSTLGLAFAGMRARPLRAWLTVIGIVIGVAAVIALITVSQGLKNAIGAQFEQFGTDRIMVMPMGFAPPGSIAGLTTDDVEDLGRLSEFEYLLPYVSGYVSFTFKGDTQRAGIWGIPPELHDDFFDSYGIATTSGSGLEGRETGAVLGSLAATDLFEKEVTVGDNLYVDERKIEVLGIMEPFGNPEDDFRIQLPEDLARELVDRPDAVDFIDLKLKTGVDINRAVLSVERTLDRTHDSEDYQVITPEQLLEQFNTILGVVQTIVVGIAAISLVVGGVGIMNSMFTSVLERKRDIGILKSIGARKKDIIILFVTESILVALIGGAIGLALGIGISILVGQAAAASNFDLLKIIIEPWLLLFGMAFAVVTGALSGLLPAYQAANMQPVEALRK